MNEATHTRKSIEHLLAKGELDRSELVSQALRLSVEETLQGEATAAPRAFGDRLAKNGMAPKAVIGAVMRKLAHLI